MIISQIKGEVSKIEATPTLEASDDAKLRGLQELLETSKEELRHLDWIGFFFFFSFFIDVVITM